MNNVFDFQKRKKQKEMLQKMKRQGEELAYIVVEVGEKIYPLEQELFEKRKVVYNAEEEWATRELFQDNEEELQNFVNRATTILQIELPETPTFERYETYNEILYDLNMHMHEKRYGVTHKEDD